MSHTPAEFHGPENPVLTGILPCYYGTMRVLLFLGAVFAFLGVAAGAFGAHSLKTRLDQETLSTFEVAVRYQMYHALGLLLVALLAQRYPGPQLLYAGWAMVLGILVFSGSLYLLCLTGTRWLGAVTPLGGIGFLAAWILVGWGVWTQK